MKQTEKPLAESQNFQGWGCICVNCIHVFEDKKKYIEPQNLAPRYPCRAMPWVGVKDLEAGDDSIQHLPQFTLNKRSDETEDCELFEVKK